MNKEQLKCKLSDIKKVAHKWLFLEDDTVIDVMCAVYVTNYFDSDPLWVLFVAPPSCAKTELLRAFDGHKDCYFLSNLTPATLISGKDKKNPSLLFQINGKTLILKDFGTILVMRSESQQEILAQLREVYDGNYSKAFGNRKPIHWTGRIGFMGAATPIYDRHHSVISALGDRFLLYRGKRTDVMKTGFQALKAVGFEAEMRKELNEVFQRFICQFEDKKLQFAPVWDSDVKEKTVILTALCTNARCAVWRDRYTRAVETIPEPEGPARLIKQFSTMAVSLALVYGKNDVDHEVYEIIKRMGRDLMPRLRLKILKNLWTEKVFSHVKEWRTTREIGEAINVPTNTVKLSLEDLMLVDLLNRDRDSEGDTSPYKWQLNDKCYDLLRDAEVFERVEQLPF